MIARSIRWLGGAALVALLAVSAVELRERDDAAKLIRRAEHLLSASLSHAPELSDLAASDAVVLARDALALHDSALGRGTLAYAQALSAYQRGRTERAQRLLSRARAERGDAAGPAMLQAALHLEDGDQEQAAQQLALARKLAPGNARALAMKADLELDAGEPAAARSSIEQALRIEADAATLLNRRGLAHEALGNLDEARADYDRAIELDPDLPHPHINIGRLERSAGRMAEAEHAFDVALRRTAALPDAWLGRGLCRIAQGDLDGGAIDIARARELAPAEPAPLLAQADVELARGEVEHAIDMLRAALALDDLPVAFLKLGNALMHKHEAAEAARAYRDAIERDAQLAAAHNGLGAALIQLGNHDQAEAELDRAAELDRTDPNPLLNLAQLRKKVGDEEGAEAALLAAVARSPK